MRYIVDWNPTESFGGYAKEDAAGLADAMRKAAAKSKQFGLAYAVAINAAGETVGAIGYADGRQDSKEGVVA